MKSHVVSRIRGRRTSRQLFRRRKSDRNLRFEPLEARRLLAITVDTLVDEADGSIVDGDISLRDAIAAAAPGETIDFTVTGTINLSLGQLVIDKGLRIQGPGAEQLTIDAQGNSRVLRVEQMADVDITGLTITGGNVAAGEGGGILNYGSLGLGDVVIAGNSAGGDGGGIRTEGSLTIIDSVVSDNHTGASGGGLRTGGGVVDINDMLLVSDSVFFGNTAGSAGGGMYVTGGLTATVTRSVVSGNMADNGGGIFVTLADFTLASSSVAGNTAADAGGGVNHDFFNLQLGSSANILDSTISGNTAAVGGGIYSRTYVASGGGSARTDVLNSTISGNTATSGGGGLFNEVGRTSLESSTITNNTAPDVEGSGVAAVRDFATTVVRFSIIAGNTNSDIDEESTGPNSDPAFVSFGHNVVGTGNAVASFDASTDQIGVLLPGLGSLFDNGGPMLPGDNRLLTHALLPASPALEAGSATSPPAFDQRGAPYLRQFDSNGDGLAQMDVGAFEAQPRTLVVDALIDESDGNFAPGDLSLREAIELANVNIGADTILFDATLTSSGAETIELSLGQLLVTDAVTITGPGANRLTIDAGGASRAFNIDDLDNANDLLVAISDLTVTGGSVVGQAGGGIRNRELLTLEGVAVSGNSATNGGGIDSRAASLTLRNSTVSANQATSDGGGIFSNSAALTVNNSTISGNTAAEAGGGIYMGSGGGFATVFFSTITDNTAAANRGSGLAIAGLTTGAAVGGTILADNTDSDVDVVDGGNPANILSQGYNLVGSGNAAFRFGGAGDTTGQSAMLGPLASNGGPTRTHAPSAGSLAIDGGNPSLAAGVGGVPLFDQRGDRFTRVADGDGAGGARIDIGAYEAQAPPPALPGDYNLNGSVGAADYVLWRKSLGDTGVAFFSGADGNGDSDITEADYDVWTANFGAPSPGAAASFSRDPTGSADGTVARPEAATGMKQLAATTTSFAEPQNVPPDRFTFEWTSSSRTTRPVLAVADRFAPLQRSQLDLLLTNSSAAIAIDDAPDSRPVRSRASSRAVEPVAIDDAFETLDDWLL